MILLGTKLTVLNISSLVRKAKDVKQNISTPIIEKKHLYNTIIDTLSLVANLLRTVYTIHVPG